MTAAGGTEPIVKEVQIDAAPETVFGFFTEPEKLTRWLCIEATTDPRPGGINHQTHRDHDGRLYYLRSEFLEVSPPSRVVFSWSFGESSGTSTVEVTLEPVANGTLVRLVHSGLAEADRADHDAGWEELIAGLPAVVAA